MSDDQEWTEEQFEALVCLHMLKPGQVLTEADCWAIEYTRKQADAVENNVVDAFDDGRKHGIVSVAGKTDADMFAEIERLRSELSCEKALARFYHRSCSTEFIRGAAACRETMACFVDQGGDPVTANSIRLNWSPSWGDDPGAGKADAPSDRLGLAVNEGEGAREAINPSSPTPDHAQASGIGEED